jgi:hypothetical protein
VDWGSAKQGEAKRTPVATFPFFGSGDLVGPTGEMVLRYEPVAFNLGSWPRHMQGIVWPSTTGAKVKETKSRQQDVRAGVARLSGLNVPALYFGTTPPSPARRRYAASAAAANSKYPRLWVRLKKLARAAAEFGEGLPLGDYEGAIPECWKIPGTPFTAAIVNSQYGSYPYHRDANNVKGSWSVMAVVDAPGRGGGYLSMPEFEISLTVPGGSFVAFQGATHWHGVTPITGGRWSIVFYANATLATAADTPAGELERAMLARTRYEMEGAEL